MANSRIQISLSDPWELGESLKWQPICGELIRLALDPQGGRALIKFDNPISHRGVLYHFSIAVPRHVGSNLKDIHASWGILCGFTGVSNEHAKSELALSTNHWRGGLAFVGTIKTSL
jgi:hypothetical protein